MNETSSSLAGYSANEPKRSLILAGGGMRVAWQAGVLLALEEADLKFAHFDGTSGGTINLAMLLSGLSPREMCERWRTLPVKDFISMFPLAEYTTSLHWPGLGDARGLREKVYPHLGISADRVRACGIEATFNICNFTRKQNVAVSHREIDLDYLIACISLPMITPAVERDGNWYTDSVWIKDANLMEAVKRGAEELWLVWCIGNTPTYHNGLFREYVHMIEMSANGVLLEEFDRIREINDRIICNDSPYGQRRPITLHVIKPSYALPLDPDFYLGRIDAATLISLGYEATKCYLNDRSAMGVNFDWEATSMKEALGIAFREQMSGGFALGETDPVAGAQRGPQLVMHASIHIDNIDEFLKDKNHLGGLSGTIDYPPFDTGIPCFSGVFNLFSPSEDPRMRLMVYQLGFQHAGESYYLAGQKQVRDDPGLDLWADTTTLFTRLHKGTNETGPVVGAGILRLGVSDLIHLLSTFTVTNASSASEKADAVGRFGKFFLGSLWKAYVEHVPA